MPTVAHPIELTCPKEGRRQSAIEGLPAFLHDDALDGMSCSSVGGQQAGDTILDCKHLPKVGTDASMFKRERLEVGHMPVHTLKPGFDDVERVQHQNGR